jgi:hypothetical protein
VTSTSVAVVTWAHADSLRSPGPVSVVRPQARRRWLVVACGVALLCGLPSIIAARPVPDSSLSAVALRARILASAGVAYQGYSESSVSLGLPNLPDLGQVSTLLDGITDQYTWYLSAGRWRADIITAAGENDTYQTSQGTYLWDYSSNLLTQIVGTQPFRLPRAADLLPPALARRLLSYASPADHISRLPSQRIAGVDAAGLRLLPADRVTTVGEIDVWADPANGLPVEVTVTGRGATQPVLVTRFLDLNERPPALATVTPAPAPGVGVTTTRLPDVSGTLKGLGPLLPSHLAGMSRVASPGGLADIAAYGTGFSRFAVLPLPSRVGDSALDAADNAGAGGVTLAGGVTGALVQTPLVNVLLVQAAGGGPVYLLTGTVAPSLLVRSGSDLLADLQGVAP